MIHNVKALRALLKPLVKPDQFIERIMEDQIIRLQASETKAELLEQFVEIVVANGYIYQDNDAGRLINELVFIYEHLPEKLEINEFSNYNRPFETGERWEEDWSDF